MLRSCSFAFWFQVEVSTRRCILRLEREVRIRSRNQSLDLEFANVAILYKRASISLCFEVATWRSDSKLECQRCVASWSWSVKFESEVWIKARIWKSRMLWFYIDVLRFRYASKLQLCVLIPSWSVNAALHLEVEAWSSNPKSESKLGFGIRGCCDSI